MTGKIVSLITAVILALPLAACGKTDVAAPIVFEDIPALEAESGGGAATEHEPPDTAESHAADVQFTVATFNIKHGADGLDKVADAIRGVSPDVVGLEEVDVGCARSNFADEPAKIARLAGFDHYAFSKAISLGDGEYGTAILSKYPIESFEVVPLDPGRGEGRSVGHAVISVGGVTLDVLVTHLSYEDRDARGRQLEYINTMLKGFDRYVLTGDFNSFELEEIYETGGYYFVNRPGRQYDTFRRFSGYAPDNIIVSEGFTELSSGVSDAEGSDHRLLFATFSISAER